MGSFGAAQAVSFSSGWTSKMGSFGKFAFRPRKPEQKGDESHKTPNRNAGECDSKQEVLCRVLCGTLRLCEKVLEVFGAGYHAAELIPLVLLSSMPSPDDAPANPVSACPGAFRSES